MTKWLAAGGVLFVSGLLKIWQHTSAPMTLEDYLAFRCGSVQAHGDSFLTFAGHCWGCPVSVIGAAMILSTLFMALKGWKQPARHSVSARRF